MVASAEVVDIWAAVDVSSAWVVWATVLCVTGGVVTSVVKAVVCVACKCVTDTSSGATVVASVATEIITDL